MGASAGIGAGASSSGATSGGMLAALGGPVGLAIAAGAITAPLIISQFGKGRKKADEFVGTIQKPFGERIQSIFDPITEARKAGTLTYDQASSALDRFNAEVADFTQAQQQFETLGGDYATVAQQSRQTMDPLIAQWRTDLQAHLDAMPKPPDTTAAEPDSAPSLDTILGGTTAGEAASRAALRARRQATPGGRQSTILAGRLGAVGTPGQRRGLLGY